MDYAIYLATFVGAVGLYLLMPSPRRRPVILGALLAAGALAGLLIFLLNHFPQHRPGLYYYLFTAIALVAAVCVITHRRPVYSALYFVLVVLAVAGLFLLLEAQFMAFAMILIYAGAILVTYLFVIMLATLPTSSGDSDSAPFYDRTARQPLPAVLMGLALLAVILNVIFAPDARLHPASAGVGRASSSEHHLAVAIEKMPGRVTGVLKKYGLIPADATIDHYLFGPNGEAQRMITPVRGDQQLPAISLLQTMPDGQVLSQAVDDSVGNIQRVGLNLFEGHTLGIELAGVILLLAMVGAIVIARKIVVEEQMENSPTA